MQRKWINILFIIILLVLSIFSIFFFKDGRFKLSELIFVIILVIIALSAPKISKIMEGGK